MSRYILAGTRPGFDFSGLERVDLPPNNAGISYTEFRSRVGAVQAAVMTCLLCDDPMPSPDAATVGREAAE